MKIKLLNKDLKMTGTSGGSMEDTDLGKTNGAEYAKILILQKMRHLENDDDRSIYEDWKALKAFIEKL